MTARTRETLWLIIGAASLLGMLWDSPISTRIVALVVWTSIVRLCIEYCTIKHIINRNSRERSIMSKTQVDEETAKTLETIKKAIEDAYQSGIKQGALNTQLEVTRNVNAFLRSQADSSDLRRIVTVLESVAPWLKGER